jgi:prophage regulatory protein
MDHRETHSPTAKSRLPNRHGRRAAAATARRNDAEAVPAGVTADRIIREPECKQRTGLSRSTRWRLERVDKFPRRRRLSEGCSGWLESEIAAWIAAR